MRETYKCVGDDEANAMFTREVSRAVRGSGKRIEPDTAPLKITCMVGTHRGARFIVLLPVFSRQSAGR